MRRTYAALLTAALAALSVAAFGAADKATYNFETSTQGWKADATPGSVSLSKAEHFAGSSSLALHVKAGGKVNRFSTLAPPFKPGGSVTFHVWVPSKGVTSIQPFLLDGAYKWTGKWTGMWLLKGGAWNTLVLKVPANAKAPIWKVGIEVTPDATSSPVAYIDSVG